MNFKEVEKLMYEDEEFLEWLPIIVEENWKAARPNEKLGFFAQLQRLVHKVNEIYPEQVAAVEMEPGVDQHIVLYDDCLYMDKLLFTRSISPYEIMANYFFELAIVDFFVLRNDKEFIETELGRKIVINADESLIGEWDNYFGRKNENFFVQPITRESSKIARGILYNLLKYMDSNYGMDKYIGSKVSNLMIGSFRDEKMDEETEKNFKEMAARSLKKLDERKELDALNEYLNNADYDNMSDDEFYALFNKKIIGVLELPTIGFLFKKFAQRELAGFEDLDKALANYGLGLDEEKGIYIDINELRIYVNSYQQAFYNFLISINNLKLSHGLVTEIDDKEFLEEAKLCYGYMLGLTDGKGHMECDYLPSAFTYYEYRNKMVDIYYNKINDAIKKSKFYSDGSPCTYAGDFSKYEAYLKFAFDKSYDEVKKEQFEKLEKDFLAKNGGKR